MPKVINPDENIQPRARVYLNHIGSNYFDGVQYMAWIVRGRAAYKQKYDVLGISDHDRFTEFLKTFPVKEVN